ncbi:MULTISPECIES: glycosyltransferase [unclassified Pseudodesulfovibrio]|uniref:glycosyltransferase family protein n=1 Tax=unclassified Pseudodesulfovibrio TaxID=2661612 RepID=UPI0013E37829|nr:MULTISPECIES: glycosyltransferase [unclassified Pseudodesulfovibrio]MCJ2165048.1 DUF3880 domain-containing protein [Pseudodesulfovibrio sp. S3-i]
MTKSMPATKTQFEWRVNRTLDEAPVVFLGLGPEPNKLPEWFDLPNEEIYYYLESQDFIDQVDGWEQLVPTNFERITPEEFTIESSSNAHVTRYLPVQKAFPSFFAPLTARLSLHSGTRPRLNKTVWLPTGDDDLLVKELAHAFRARGYSVTLIDHEALGKYPGSTLPDLLQQGVPDLFFSVNFKGLDHFGLGHAILREAGVQVAVWLVDNPFNILTTVKSAYWKDIRLFVTDHSFIGPLIEIEARWVTHLPLATSRDIFEASGTLPDHATGLEGHLIFVGRSRFPKMDQFFAGETIDSTDVDEVLSDSGSTRFDYHWWRERLGITPLWPGNQGRAVGAGTEFASHNWKRRCLESAGKVIIFGDDGWKGIKNADVRPFVDYYAHLPAIYRTAAVTLNVTGMQLPAGLTQRHFDVWCAGGFLITDAHPGLKIFPDELVAPVSFTRPDEIHDLVIRFREDTKAKQELRRAWQECIQQNHTYLNRVDTVLTALSL